MLGRNGFRGPSRLSVLSCWLEIVQEEPYICSKAVVPTEGADLECQLSAHLTSSFLKGNSRFPHLPPADCCFAHHLCPFFP